MLTLHMTYAIVANVTDVGLFVRHHKRNQCGGKVMGESVKLEM